MRRVRSAALRVPRKADLRRLLEFQRQKLSDSKRRATQHKPTSTENLTANLCCPRKARCTWFRNMTQQWIFHIAMRFTRLTASWGVCLAASHTRSQPIRPNNHDLASTCTRHSKYTPSRCHPRIFHNNVGVAPASVRPPYLLGFNNHCHISEKCVLSRFPPTVFPPTTTHRTHRTMASFGTYSTI